MFFPILEGRQKNDSRLNRDFLVVLGRNIIIVQYAGLLLIKGLLPAIKQLLDPGRDLISRLLHLCHGLTDSHSIPCFKRAHFPAKAPLQGIIYIHNVIGNFWYAIGRVDKHFAYMAKGKLPGKVFSIVERFHLLRCA